jgi:hypothetical protein
VAKKKNKWELGFMQGRVWAAAELIRTFNDTSRAKFLLQEDHLLEDPDLVLCDDYDLSPLRGAEIIPRNIVSIHG